MGLSDKVFSVFDLISDAVSKDAKKRTKLPSGKFVVLEIMEDQSKVRNTRETEILEGMYGGYNAFGQDIRVIDPDTIVKNLKSSKIEIREKIFVDKPVHKQLEVTLELKEELNPLKNAKARNNGSAAASYDLDLDDREEKKGAQQTIRQEDDFLYGQISGSMLQEFRVNKVNRKGKYTARILCIDGNSFFHKKVEKKTGFFGSMMPKGILNN